MRKALLVAALFLALVVGTGAPDWAPSTAAGPQFHCNQVNLHPNSLPNGQLNTAYAATLWLTPANPALQVTVTNVTGNVPGGLLFTPGPNINQVTLSGTPNQQGTFTFTVELGGIYVLGAICKVTRTYTVVIL